MLNIQLLYAFLNRLSKREKIVFYSAALFVSFMLMDRLIISPITYKIESLNKQISEEETAISRGLHILAQKDRILAESAKFNSFFVSLKSEEEEISSLLKEVEALANKSSVYLVDMKPASLKEQGSLKKYIITLNCEAQMEQLAEFMYNIESSGSLLSVEKYQIGPKSKESSVAQCNMTISKIIMP